MADPSTRAPGAQAWRAPYTGARWSAELAHEAARSDREAAARMHWLVQVVVMALGLVVSVTAAVVIVDGWAQTAYVADVVRLVEAALR